MPMLCGQGGDDTLGSRLLRDLFSPMGSRRQRDGMRSGMPDAPALVKKIGKTTSIVRVHFSETSVEKIKAGQTI